MAKLIDSIDSVGIREMKKINLYVALATIGLLLVMASVASTQSSAIIQQANDYYEDNYSKGRTGENWARVLLAFGQPAPSSAPSNLTPMTANEACANVANWSGWQPFCDELTTIESAQATPTPSVANEFSGEEPYWADGTNCFWWESNIPQVTVVNALLPSQRVYQSRGNDSDPQEFIVLPQTYSLSWWHIGDYRSNVVLPGNAIFRFSGSPDIASIKTTLNVLVQSGFFPEKHTNWGTLSGDNPFTSDEQACKEAYHYFTNHGNIKQ